MQILHDASIIGSEEVLQYQAGEQLCLRECLGREAMCISWQTPLPYAHRYQCHPPWRLGCVTHAPCSRLVDQKAQPYKRRTSGVFYRASLSPLLGEGEGVMEDVGE